MATNTISVTDFTDVNPDNIVYPNGYEEMLLTTIDNPFSPFDEFEQWLWFDRKQGYNTNQVLDRLIGSTSKFNETPLGEEVENKFYYSTMVALVENSDFAPFIIVSEGDYDAKEGFKFYTPSGLQKLWTAIKNQPTAEPLEEPSAQPT